MKPTVKVRTVVKSNRTPEILKALARAKGSNVTVGVHRGAGEYFRKNSAPVEKVALWLEFGTEKMHARPFMRPAILRNKGAIARITAKSLVGIAYLNHTVSRGLSTIGYSVVLMIQNVIKSNVGPALSGKWDPPKGYLGWRHKHYSESGQRTLIASGLLLRSVRFALHLTEAAKNEKLPPALAMYKDGHASVEGRKVKGPAKEGRDEFGRYLKKTPDQKAQARKKAVQQAKAVKASQREQRSQAAAHPKAHEQAFNNQRRAFVRADKPTS